MENYYNYFTEIERYYQTKRESFTLLSSLDWVLIESWKSQGMPLEIVLKGMDRAFSRSRRRISSLAYCVHAVSEVAEEQKDLKTEAPDQPEFSQEEIRAYLDQQAGKLDALAADFGEFSSRIEAIAASLRSLEFDDLRSGENALTALEDKLLALVSIVADDATLITIRESVQTDLQPYRSRMNVEQLSMLEQQLQKRKLMEHYGLPRLSLFYLI